MTSTTHKRTSGDCDMRGEDCDGWVFMAHTHRGRTGRTTRLHIDGLKRANVAPCRPMEMIGAARDVDLRPDDGPSAPATFRLAACRCQFWA